MARTGADGKRRRRRAGPLYAEPIAAERFVAMN
jgi:hypothetical protein